MKDTIYNLKNLSTFHKAASNGSWNSKLFYGSQLETALAIFVLLILLFCMFLVLIVNRILQIIVNVLFMSNILIKTARINLKEKKLLIDSNFTDNLFITVFH